MENFFFAPSFFTRPPYFYPSTFVFPHPNDGWTGLYILHKAMSVLINLVQDIACLVKNNIKYFLEKQVLRQENAGKPRKLFTKTEYIIGQFQPRTSIFKNKLRKFKIITLLELHKGTGTLIGKYSFTNKKVTA